jgi:hypothetical protein
MKIPSQLRADVRVRAFSAICIMAIAGCGGAASPDRPGQGPSVTVRWKPSASNVAGYNVYRAAPPGVPIRINGQAIGETRFVDRNVEPGYLYSYFVTAVGFGGLESIPSARADIKVPKRGIGDALAHFFARLRGTPSNTPVP